MVESTKTNGLVGGWVGMWLTWNYKVVYDWVEMDVRS